MTFDLALKGLGHTSPNPLVGAVIVSNGKIIGTGHHQKYGSAKAEVNAILDAKAKGHSTLGATLYCNLEPLASLIMDEKISTVVISNGEGTTLKEHGVEVITGVLESEGLLLNEVYFKFSKTKSPFIHLIKDNHEAIHDFRQKYDCVLVDRETIDREDLSLTINSDKFEKVSQPLRLVISSLKELNRDWKILTDEFRRNTMMIATDDEVNNHPEIVRFLESSGVALLSLKKNDEGKVDLKAMLKSLASLKLTSILVEGSPGLSDEFFKVGLVDKID